MHDVCLVYNKTSAHITHSTALSSAVPGIIHFAAACILWLIFFFSQRTLYFLQCHSDACVWSWGRSLHAALQVPFIHTSSACGDLSLHGRRTPHLLHWDWGTKWEENRHKSRRASLLSPRPIFLLFFQLVIGATIFQSLPRWCLPWDEWVFGVSLSFKIMLLIGFLRLLTPTIINNFDNKHSGRSSQAQREPRAFKMGQREESWMGAKD